MMVSFHPLNHLHDVEFVCLLHSQLVVGDVLIGQSTMQAARAAAAVAMLTAGCHSCKHNLRLLMQQ
jgi:hypothetical protein